MENRLLQKIINLPPPPKKDKALRCLHIKRTLLSVLLLQTTIPSGQGSLGATTTTATFKKMDGVGGNVKLIHKETPYPLSQREGFLVQFCNLL